jgi:multidrug efflux pump subunit AcrA (membrane-fusion protein)
VDPQTRAFGFYLSLPNKIALDQTNADGIHFLDWQYKPGQRLELRVPVEQWTDRIVLPVEAVVEEGAETYVYQQNGDHFDRVPVHVEYRDQQSVVVANDGAVFPGDVVAARGAYQIHLAMKNKSGGGVDPHAGHNH